MSETAMSTQDWCAPLESMRAAEESWEDSRAADEIDEEEEGWPLEWYAEELESVRDRAR
jgi:hypothetical protein